MSTETYHNNLLAKNFDSELIMFHELLGENYLNNENNYSMRNTYAWWTFGLYIWSMLDAYVDAHLSSFPVNKSNQSNEEFTE